MLDGTVSPALFLSSTVRFSTNFQRKRTTGISPEHPKTQVSAKPDAERLTVESAMSHFEFLEVRQSAPFRRNSTSKLVRSVLATRQIENLKRSWKHLWQRTCVRIIQTKHPFQSRTFKRSIRMLSGLPSSPQ